MARAMATGPARALAWIDARLVAPRATVGERALSYLGALAGAVFALVLAIRAGLTILPIVVVTLIGFDLYGGTIVNATRAAKAWYHRPGRTVRHHFAFVAVHVHPFVIALVVPGFGWVAAGAVYALEVAGACAVLLAPAHVRRPIAFAATALALTVALTLLDIPREVAWFAPVLLIKLLLAHLLPEDGTPARPAEEDTDPRQ